MALAKVKHALTNLSPHLPGALDRISVSTARVESISGKTDEGRPITCLKA